MIVANVIATLRSRDWIKDCSVDIPDLKTAFDIQDKVVMEIAQDHAGFSGYKIAFNSPELLKKTSLPHPGMGRIFADQVYQNTVSLNVSDYENLMIEPEIAAVLGADITPGADVCAENITQYVDYFLPAFEILNRRSVDGLTHVPTIIAHNVFNAGIVIGDKKMSPNALNAAEIITDCRDNGEIIVQGQGLAPQNIADALAFLAGHFTSRGQTLKAGSLLLLGAHCPLYPVGKNCEITLDMGMLGNVSFST